MFSLPLISSRGTEVSVPLRLPDAITFACFLPGLGVASACLHPSGLETDARGTVAADVEALEAWHPNDKDRASIRLDGAQDACASEQAVDVLSYILDRLNARLGNVERAGWLSIPLAERRRQVEKSPAAVLLLIADMAEAEIEAREAWESLPNIIRSGSHQRGNIPRDPSGRVFDMPSANALAAHVEALVESAQNEADANARKLEEAWLAEQAEELAAARRAERTDHGIDLWKEGR